MSAFGVLRISCKVEAVAVVKSEEGVVGMAEEEEEEEACGKGLRGAGRLRVIGGLNEKDKGRGVCTCETSCGPFLDDSEGRCEGVSLAVSIGLSGLLNLPAIA